MSGNKATRIHVDKSRFAPPGADPATGVARVKGIPWPRISPDEDVISERLQRFYNEETDKIEVPLQHEYALQAMDYLDTPEAEPLFKWQADYIVKHNLKTIVDVGCRHGPVLEHLYDMDYLDDEFYYFGFDTSAGPIQYATERWENFDNITFKCTSWDDIDSITIDKTSVDCCIYSGVLLYAPNNHMELFESLSIGLYNAKHAIIQEPCKNQTHWLEVMHLNTIQLELHLYKTRWQVMGNDILDLPIFSGKREVLGLKLTDSQ